MKETGSKVRLNCNLTTYHRSLVSGLEGVTVGRGRNDCFVKVRFPEVTLDIVWNSLNEVLEP